MFQDYINDRIPVSDKTEKVTMEEIGEFLRVMILGFLRGRSPIKAFDDTSIFNSVLQ